MDQSVSDLKIMTHEYELREIPCCYLKRIVLETKLASGKKKNHNNLFLSSVR